MLDSFVEFEFGIPFIQTQPVPNPKRNTMKKVITLFYAALLLPSFAFGTLPVGEKPPLVVLEG